MMIEYKIDASMQQRLEDLTKSLDMSSRKVAKIVQEFNETFEQRMRFQLNGFNPIVINYMVRGQGQWYRNDVACSLPEKGSIWEYEWRCTFGK